MVTVAALTAPSDPSVPAPGEPLLESGDRLTREEFERRYERLPHVKKAELVEGLFICPHPSVRENTLHPITT
jgi:hypothetical protein